MLACLVQGLLSGDLAAGNPFDIAGKKPSHAYLLASPEITPPADAARVPPMLLHLQGVRHVLSDSDITALRAAVGEAKIVKPTKRDEPLARFEMGTLCLEGKNGTSSKAITKRFMLWRDGLGKFFIQEIAEPRAATDAPVQDAKDAKNVDAKPVLTLGAARIAPIIIAWPSYTGDGTLPKGHAAPGTSFDISPHAAPSLFTLTKDTIQDRFLSGGQTKLDATTRRIAEEKFVARLPKGYDPRLAAGMLVFVHESPKSEAMIPDELCSAADELGLICVAAGNTGNDRPAVDRYQLTLDAIETIRERYILDETRVYTTGISGGGKISSHVWAAFPECSRGSVPIVAVGAYENLRRDDGRFWRGDFPKPSEKGFTALKGHRLAAITGDHDGNQDSIRKSLKVMARDGLDVKLFEYEDMGHQMATGERFAQALRWADAPAREFREQTIKEAEHDLAASLTPRQPTDPTPTPERNALVRIITNAPWSLPAWQARELLARSVSVTEHQTPTE